MSGISAAPAVRTGRRPRVTFLLTHPDATTQLQNPKNAVSAMSANPARTVESKRSSNNAPAE